MSDFNNNLKGAFNKKTELRDRLRKKIQAKQNLRMNKHSKQKQMGDISKNFRLNNNGDIRDISITLMMEVERLYKNGITHIPQIDKALNNRYDFFKKNYFGIYRAILARELPINVLDMMLNYKHKIDSNELTAEQASFKVGDVIAKKLNVDVEALKNAKPN